jgi:hypothetical protein
MAASGNRQYDAAWNAVFKRLNWLQDAYDTHKGNIVLIGIDLDNIGGDKESEKRPHIALAVYDRGGDIQYTFKLFCKSLRGTFTEHRISHLERVDLTISRFDISETSDFENGFGYLFREGKDGLHTKYCFWKDPEKKIRTLDSNNIIGIDGPVSRLDSLRPIFLLHLIPPRLNIPSYFPPTCAVAEVEQYIFRSFNGSFEQGQVGRLRQFP